MRKDPTEFRKRFAKWKEGGKPYKDGKISDELYVRTMEKVAADNWLKWGEDSEDAALTRILNDNTYDYRGYYSKYPNSAANADTHWSDEFKTVWHPTFSLESTYSGKKSQYNPYGYPGGTWQGELFNPQWYQQHLDTGFYKDGYPKLPKFEGGEEKFKLKKTPEYVLAGVDNSWSNVSNDDMGAVFQEVVARPLSRGGNTTEGDWKRQWSPKYEKPLEIVSPEFDILTLGAGARINAATQTFLKNRKIANAIAKGRRENSVLESYNQVAANKDIGNAYDYLDFLDNIYPNSKLNATFYHGGPKGITKFKSAKELKHTNKGINSGTKDYGIYLADDKSLALYYAESHKKGNRRLYNVRVNVQNPMRYETDNWYLDKMSTTGNFRFRPGEITLKWYDRLNLKNYDGIYHTKSKNVFDNGELVMFDGNNIHIMGTPEESQMFRAWKLNPLYSFKPLLEEIPITPQQYDKTFKNYIDAAKPAILFGGLTATPIGLFIYLDYLKNKKKQKYLNTK